MHDDELSKMTGESVYGNKKDFNEISLNGDLGRFTLFDRNKKDASTGDYVKQPLDAGLKLQFDPETGEKTIIETKPLKVVFLKVRRTLSYYNPAGGSMRTTEHNHKGEDVILYGPERGDKRVGSAEAIRAEYPDLRTVQKVYVYLPGSDGKVLRLVVKGSSLSTMDEKKVPGVVKFYEYLQSFNDDEHFWEYITEITPVPEKGLKGVYYAMSFTRGDKLTDEQIEKMKGLIREVHQQTVQEDADTKNRMKAIENKVEQLPEDETPGVVIKAEDFPEGADSQVSYPAEEINPEDIPF